MNAIGNTDTEQALCDELEAWCVANHLKYTNAEDLLADLSDDSIENAVRIDWLRDFVDRWDAMQDEADRAHVSAYSVTFEDLTLRVVDNPAVPALLTQLGHVQSEIKRLTFRMRPDVLGEDNRATIEYERGCGRAIMNLLRAFAV